MWTILAVALTMGWEERKEAEAVSEIRRGDTVVTINKVHVCAVPLVGFRDKIETVDEDYLMVSVAISNSSDTKKLDYGGWAAGLLELDRRAIVRDDLGNTYRRVRFGIRKVFGQYPEGDSIYPEKVILDHLVFEKPVAKARELRITLPGSQIGEEKDLEFWFQIGAPDSKGVIFDPSAERDAKLKQDRENKREREKFERIKRREKEAEEAAAELEKTRPEREEKAAASKLRSAEALQKAGKQEAYRRVLKEVADKYPETGAGKKAAKLLK